jgi:hypothetical protein
MFHPDLLGEGRQMSTVVAGSRVSGYLLSASDDSFSSSLALFHELSLFSLMWSKSSELIEKLESRINKGTWCSDSDHFHEKVVAKSREFAGLSQGERLLQTVGELQKLMSVSPRDLRTSFDLCEVADDIGAAAVNILRQDKDAKFAGTDIGSMIEYQMTRIFGGLNIRMEELSSTQQQNLVDRVREFLQSLPADQQRFIMNKLGAADLSESAIRQAIASGAMWTAFAAAAQVFGFAFYTTAAHLLAIVSLHMLPFAAYVGLSSTIAVLSSPWMLPIFAGLGICYYRRKNRGLRQSMAPLIVTTLCLSGMEVQARTPGHRQSAIDEALSLWVTARRTLDEKRAIAAAAKSDRDQAQSRLTVTRNELAQARAGKNKATSERSNLEQELERGVNAASDAIAESKWSPSLTGPAAKVQEIEAQLARARQKRNSKKGFWDTIGGYIEYGFDSLSINGNLSSAKAALVQQVKSAWPREGASYPPNAQSLLRSMEERTSHVLAAEEEINRLTVLGQEQSRKLDQALAAFVQAESARSTSEQRYHGLGTV